MINGHSVSSIRNERHVSYYGQEFTKGPQSEPSVIRLFLHQTKISMENL